MHEGAVTRDVTNADETPSEPTVGRLADEVTFVVVDTRGRQINPLPTSMTVAEALDDSLRSEPSRHARRLLPDGCADGRWVTKRCHDPRFVTAS